MRRSLTAVAVAIAAVSQLASGTPRARACTGVRMRAGDGSVIYARTLEFEVDLESSILYVPRGKAFAGTAPGGRPGLRWTSKYAAVGVNAFHMPLLIDGMNDQGLGVGLFYFPGYARYQAAGESEAGKTLGPHELASYLLTTCADTPGVVKALGEIRVGAVELGQFGGVPPVHFVVHDREGRSVVVEYVDGSLKVHDNPLGVVTNAPTFDWHVTNLRNYMNLTVTGVPPVELSSLKFTPFGLGSGMLGLPGDFTPPSRFVRAVAFSKSALPVETALDAVRQAFHILNQFDIPRGAAREPGKGKPAVDYTQWTTAADLKNLRYYFHTYDSRTIRMVDLRALDREAREIRTIPMTERERIEDVTGRAGATP